MIRFYSPDMPQSVHADETRVVYVVTARSGLKLREGPGTAFEPLQLIPENTRVFVVKGKRRGGRCSRPAR